MTPLADLLAALGRTSDEMITICHQLAGAEGSMPFTHTTVAEAQDVAAQYASTHNVWFTVQPMDVPNIPSGSRGRRADVTSMVTLYVDLDYVHERKTSGVTQDQAALIIRDLSDILGRRPAAVVLSGYGVQPYWPTERVTPLDASILLLRWRALCIKVTEAHGGHIDKGVFDLARILRVPGPDNLKYGTAASTRLLRGESSSPLSAAELTEILDAHLPAEMSSKHDGVAREVNGDGDRVFTNEQAMASFITPALAVIRDTPWSAGTDYWMVLWAQSGMIAAFSTMFEEDYLRGLIAQAISDGHDGAAPNYADEYQIDRAFLSGWPWRARRPTEGELSDPFSPYCTLPPRLAEIRERYDIPENVTPTTEVLYSAAVATLAPGADLPSQRAVPNDPQAVSPPDGVRRMKATRGDEMTMRAATWLWEHDGEFWLPLRSLVLLGGREGVGKSTWTARLIAQVTTGKMHGEYLGQPKGVVIAAAEDSWEVTILPRLVAAGVDLKRVFRVEAEQNGMSFGLTLPTDVPALADLVQEQQVAMIVLDPLLGTVQGKLDTHKDSDVRQALAPISALAFETHCTVIGLIHQNKNQNGDLLTRMMGSRAFAAVARAVLMCAESKDTETAELLEGDAPKKPRRFLFGQLKNNLGPRVEGSVTYEIAGALAGLDPETGKPIRTSRIQVLKDENGRYLKAGDVEDMVMASEKAVREKTDRRRAPDGNATERCQAAVHLRLLAGPLTSSELKAALIESGFSEGSIKKAMAAGIESGAIEKAGDYHAPIYSLPGLTGVAGGPA